MSVLQASSLQYEMLLLTDSISKEDSCWELRLRCGELKQLKVKASIKYCAQIHALCLQELKIGVLRNRNMEVLKKKNWMFSILGSMRIWLLCLKIWGVYSRHFWGALQSCGGVPCADLGGMSMSLFQLSASFWWQWTLRLRWLWRTSHSCACAFFKSWSNHLLQPARKTRYCLKTSAEYLKMSWLQSTF